MEKQIILAILRNLQVASFNELNHGVVLGTLSYQNFTFQVTLHNDSVCQYIFLEYKINNAQHIQESVKTIEERVIAGRYIIEGENIKLSTFFPIFQDDFVEQQVNNAICVMERMIHICNH